MSGSPVDTGLLKGSWQSRLEPDLSVTISGVGYVRFVNDWSHPGFVEAAIERVR